MSSPDQPASSSAPPPRLNTTLIAVTGAAVAELAPVWRLKPSEIGTALMDVMPALVDKWALAAASAAADWYDELRDTAGVPGRFMAIVPPLNTLGAEALAGWAAQPLATPLPAMDAAPRRTAMLDVASTQERVEALAEGAARPLEAPPAADEAARGAATLDLDSARDRAEGGLQKRLVNAANLTVTGSADQDPNAKGYMRRTRAGACKFCIMVASRGAVYTKASATFACHEHCFPAGVLVTGPTTEVGYRRAYQGELVVIRFANGQELPVTPNHPILTRRGWVPAGQISVGEDVFERSGADLASLDVPHEEDVPSRIEDVWGSRHMDRLRSVPVTAKDFHGDIGFRQSYVDVVTAHSFLANVADASAVQQFAQGFRPGAGMSGILGALATLGDPFAPLLRARTHVSNRFIGSFGPCSPYSRIFALLAKGLCVSHGPHGNARILEPAVHYSTGNAVGRGHRMNALAGVVSVQDVERSRNAVMSGSSMPTGSWANSVALQREANAIAGLPSEDGRNLIKRLAGGVKPLGVVDLSRREFSGHVYNLQTAEGWYSANGVIVHNCYCEAVPAWGGQPLPVGPYSPSARPSTAKDRARVRKWIKDNL